MKNDYILVSTLLYKSSFKCDLIKLVKLLKLFKFKIDHLNHKLVYTV